MSPNTSLHELGLESVDLVELIMELEEAHGLEIPDEDYERIRTLSDLLRWLREHGAGDDATPGSPPQG